MVLTFAASMALKSRRAAVRRQLVLFSSDVIFSAALPWPSAAPASRQRGFLRPSGAGEGA